MKTHKIIDLEKLSKEEVDKKLIDKHESDKAIIDYAFTEKKPFKMSYGFNPETQTFQKKPFQKD